MDDEKFWDEIQQDSEPWREPIRHENCLICNLFRGGFAVGIGLVFVYIGIDLLSNGKLTGLFKR